MGISALIKRAELDHGSVLIVSVTDASHRAFSPEI
jgi:hypothetical protein